MQQLVRSVQELWESKPGSVVLLTLGFLVFLFLVVDTWRHRSKRKRRAKGLH